MDFDTINRLLSLGLYGSSPYAVDGLIRLDFSPFWLVGRLDF
jgi:hypothetical protein